MKKIVFLSPMSLLDHRSGAAASVRTWLEWLTEAGFECQSLTMSVFDGVHEYPFDKIVGKNAANPDNFGKIIRLKHKGVVHNMFYTTSTKGGNVKTNEQKKFFNVTGNFLKIEKPDVIVSYGSSNFTNILQNIARRHCKKFVFYLANAEFTHDRLFRASDIFVCPSHFLAEYYKTKFNINPFVIRSSVTPEHSAGNFSLPEIRKTGFVTLINPCPEKGLTLFWRLAKAAGIKRPDITFLAVEGRSSRNQLNAKNLDIASESNVWWLPNQNDMGAVYRRTSILVFPSFWQEAAGRVIAEAQLNGIPVLASNRGGIPEQLNGGGFLFDIPVRCKSNYWAVPTESETEPWLDTIIKLTDNDEAYRQASIRARKAAEYFLPERRKKDVVEFFQSL